MIGVEAMEIEKKNTDKPSLLGMFWKPNEQFEKIRQEPKIWGVLFIITIVYGIASSLSAMTIKAEDLVVPGTLSLENAELVLPLTKFTTAIGGLFAPIFGVLISTVIHFIIVKIASKNTTFKQLFSMNTYILVIGAAGILLNNLIQYLVGQSSDISFTSIGGVLGSDSPVLATFEVFSIWQLILVAFGLHKVGQLSKGAAWTISIVFFLLGLGMSFLAEALQGIAGM